MNKKLVLYSDQVAPDTNSIDRRMLSLIGKANSAIGYIPSSSDPERFFFDQVRAYYAALGVAVEVCFELDAHFSAEMLPTLLACDAIHLSGGNTFYFLLVEAAFYALCASGIRCSWRCADWGERRVYPDDS